MAELSDVGKALLALETEMIEVERRQAEMGEAMYHMIAQQRVLSKRFKALQIAFAKLERHHGL